MYHCNLITNKTHHIYIQYPPSYIISITLRHGCHYGQHPAQHKNSHHSSSKMQGLARRIDFLQDLSHLVMKLKKQKCMNNVDISAEFFPFSRIMSWSKARPGHCDLGLDVCVHMLLSLYTHWWRIYTVVIIMLTQPSFNWGLANSPACGTSYSQGGNSKFMIG